METNRPTTVSNEYRMNEWLRQTHGPNFELLRHFLLHFFDSDLITTPGQMAPALIGAFSMMLPWLFLFVSPLMAKYKHFSQIAFPGPYRHIVRADELWLITLMMSAIGLLTAVKWQSVFPGLRDYRVLGTLPLRARQIFGAKLAALLLVSTATIVTLNLLPSFLFPAVSWSRWQFRPSLGVGILAHAAACTAACYFFFFGLVALQGVLLNLLRPRAFGRVSGFFQGILVAVMLILIVQSFSIDSQMTDAVLRPEMARWLPPVWFLGLYQTLSGNPDPGMWRLANRALTALAAAVVLALATYLVSYRRHRELLVEGLAAELAVFSAFALLCYEWTFSSWEKLPFTCSHLPGKTPMWILFLRFLGLSMALPLVHFFLLSAVYNWVAFLIVTALQLALWGRLHIARRDGWGEQRLKYDEAPEPAIHGLNLMA